MADKGKSNATAWKGLAAFVVVAGLVGGANGHHPSHSHSGGHAETVASHSIGAARAVAFARGQLGKPYCWGGTGPGCFDCSGLVMEAYHLPWTLRTSEEQWAGLRHVPGSQRHAGDLVFAPGGDGSWTSPGHVGILTGRNWVIQAYATGYPIDQVRLSKFSADAGGVVGYAEVR